MKYCRIYGIGLMMVMTKMSIAIMVTTRWWIMIITIGDIMTQRHWLEWDIRSWRWNIVGSTESVPRETQISWNGQEYNFPWFLRWDLCQISNILNLNQKSDPYLLEIMHFIDLPRCIKPNSTRLAALYVWLWNFSGNKNCCCPGQTPLKYCLPKLLSFKLGTFIWSNYTSFYAHQSE